MTNRRMAFAALTVGWFLVAQAAADVVDRLDFGVETSEQSHAIQPGAASETFTGTLGTPARRLLPLDPPSWAGGRVSFKMKVDPAQQNYFTARFSGDEVSDQRLMLYVDGKQIGWRHLGEVDQLDYGTWEPPYRGRFYYNTSPLPRSLTDGKSEVECEIRSSGRIWGYGNTFERYQKTMEEPSKGVYAVYTHTDGYFVPPTDERQGEAVTNAPVRTSPGPEVLDQVKARVNKEIDARLQAKAPLTQTQMALLAKAYDVEWTNAHDNPRAIEQILATLDGLFVQYRANPKLAHEEPSTWNPDWFGLGLCGQVLALRREQLSPRLDETIEDGAGKTLKRRDAFAEMLVDCRDWHRLNRRQYTNQSMLNDLNGIYHANRGLTVVAPEKALPEPEARRYLYESIGLEPWRDSDAGGKQWNVGPDYWQLTEKGLTKELGYVGTYGEVTDLVADIYEATRPAPGEEGDPKIKAQLVRIAVARAAMRHPAEDGEGFRAMRLEQVVGWRDSHYPGEVVYGQRSTRDASALQAAAATLDPRLVGYAQQMIADNQFFESEVHSMNDGAQPLRTTIGRLETPDQYELIQKQPKSEHRLPMTWDQPDTVFSDEEDGLVAIKNGREILYVSLYWRARFGINDLARVHYITPEIDRIAVVTQQTQFTPSGETFTWGDQTNFGFGNGGPKYPDPTLTSAHAGQTQPIAKPPAGVTATPGRESPYAGRGDFYTLRYGPYLIGLNMTKDKTFDLDVPAGARELTDRGTSATKPSSGGSVKVSPRTTAVYYIKG